MEIESACNRAGCVLPYALGRFCDLTSGSVIYLPYFLLSERIEENCAIPDKFETSIKRNKDRKSTLIYRLLLSEKFTKIFVLM
jgi:hypothetical protein